MKNSKFFKFVNGVPVPIDEDIETNIRVNKQTMSALLPAALDTAYEPRKRIITEMIAKGQDDETGVTLWKEVKKRDPYTGELLYEIDPDEYQFRNDDGTWMTKAEVGQIRLAQRFADGEVKAQEQVLDRIIGKPKQEIDQTITKLDPIAWMRERMKELNAQRKVTVDPPAESKAITVDAVVINKITPKANYI
jgi:hypothetical protein